MKNELGIDNAPWKLYGNVVVDNNGESLYEAMLDEEIPIARLFSASPELYKCLRVAQQLRCSECKMKKEEGICLETCFVNEWKRALEKANGTDA